MARCFECRALVAGGRGGRGGKLYCDGCWDRWHLNAMACRAVPPSQHQGERAQLASLCQRLRANDPSLQQLDFTVKDSKLDLRQLFQVTSALSTNTTVSKISVSQLRNCEAFTTAVAYALQVNGTVQALHVSDCGQTEVSILRQAVLSLQGNATLQSFTIDCMGIEIASTTTLLLSSLVYY